MLLLLLLLLLFSLLKMIMPTMTKDNMNTEDAIEPCVHKVQRITDAHYMLKFWKDARSLDEVSDGAVHLHAHRRVIMRAMRHRIGGEGLGL